MWFCVLRTQTLTRQSHFFLLSLIPKFPQLTNIQDRCKQFKNEIMKIRILQLVILVGIFINTNVIAQQCGTPTTGSNQDFFLSKNGITGDDSICINVSFHIVRQSNGSGGFNSSNIDLTIK